MSAWGIDTVVLMAVALEFKAFYRSKIFPRYEMACDNVLEILLDEADQLGLRVFVGNGFWGKWDDFATASDTQANRRRLLGIQELLDLFGHHKSFIGWYWPDEAEINPLYSESFIRYVDMQSSLARKLDSSKKILIAPYGTNRIAQSPTPYGQQLEQLDVDFIAYQDEVGVRKTNLCELEGVWRSVARAHAEVKHITVWADVEVFEFQGDVYRSALIPASHARVSQQISIASEYAKKILIYQYQGLIDRPHCDLRLLQ
jgi:hypothetical protein